jgi:hypothetical protein
MRLRALFYAFSLLTLSGWACSVHPQISPKPLRSFYVQSAMTSPQAGSPYPVTDVMGFAVRSDGSWVMVSYGYVAGKRSHIRDIFDVRNNVQTTIEDLPKSIQTRALSESAYKARLKRLSVAASCGGKAAGQMLDLAVEYTEEKGPIIYDNAGPVTSTTRHWLAPALGCFDLRRETIETRDRDGSLLVDTTEQAISVRFESVDAFFLIPTDYTERTPGQTFLELSRLYPNEFPRPENTDGIDAAYKAAHGKLLRH